MDKDKVYLRHILNSIKTIKEYIGEMDYEDFFKARLVQDGVIRQLEIIGEASTNLSVDFKKENNQIPWVDISGMRNKLIHEYFGVDLEVVWKVIEDDLLNLKDYIQKII